MQEKTLTAACCIIGDEILSGKAHDVNSHYLAKFLFSLGIELKHVAVVGDDMSDIGDCVQRLSRLYDFVFTGGGIGSTHDDITYDAIAKAFNLQLKFDPVTYRVIEEWAGKRGGKTELTAYHKRLATFPYPAQLLRTHRSGIPIVVVCDNIYILPGIPRLFATLLNSLRPHFHAKTNKQFYRAEIATRQQETTIAAYLEQAQRTYANVKIGSYPTFGTGEHSMAQVVVSVTGQDMNTVQTIADKIQRHVDGWSHGTSWTQIIRGRL
ncbi:MoaB/Mog domain-containing protein [Radiomyces spectabilis]|uniref:MoaB/Mog domain-containing protein n=1 Tax=Radiomyces spectabilis TaxID=64574 RepID=UPI0022200BB9|nr:MoaB/Mog domain-containing protein [Radiomyces spectabilis]KAI8384663.1 MoaB/Mog domain-containing protein [Radiomyces spectabilis]